MDWELVTLNTHTETLKPEELNEISSKLMKQKSLTSGEGVYAVYSSRNQKYLVCVINITQPSSEIGEEYYS